MRRFVNGDECDLDPEAATVREAGDRLMVRTREGTFSALSATVGDAVLVSYKGRQYRVERQARRGASHHSVTDGEIRATMPGQVVEVAVSPGADVRKGQAILVVEAMKTHQPFNASFDGRVTSISVKRGDQVAEGQILAVVEET